MIQLRKYHYVVSLGVVLFFTLSFGITYVLIEFEKADIRKEVKHLILEKTDGKDLVYFSFSFAEKEALNWKHNKEFEYKGMMYDIVRQNNTNNQYEYWCWSDHEETAANKKLDKLIAAALGGWTSEKTATLHKLFSSLYFSDYSSFSIFNYAEVKHNYRYVFTNESQHIKPATPPPDFY